MLGAIAGDIIGSVYEGNPVRTPYFHPLFDLAGRATDDSVLTVAVADWIMRGHKPGDPMTLALKYYFAQYPFAGYGATFSRWAGSSNMSPYNSWGNGSAMRVSPVGWAFDTEADVLKYAEHTAEATHNHPEGIKGAQATALAVFLARTGHPKDAIRDAVASRFGYDLTRSVDEIRPTYHFDVSCQGSVPEAIRAFLESTDYETAVRLAVSLGGDSDTQACIAGAIAEAFYGGVPAPIAEQALGQLDRFLREKVTAFRARYVIPRGNA